LIKVMALSSLLTLSMPAAPETEAVAKIEKKEETPIDYATKVALAWTVLVDHGDYASSWEQSASYFKKNVKKEVWATQAKGVREPLGAVVTRVFDAAGESKMLPGAPDGRYFVLRFKTKFANKESAIETITTMAEKNGVFRVAGYYIQ
jgi:hypothetical protein